MCYEPEHKKSCKNDDICPLRESKKSLYAALPVFRRQKQNPKKDHYKAT